MVKSHALTVYLCEMCPSVYAAHGACAAHELDAHGASAGGVIVDPFDDHVDDVDAKPPMPLSEHDRRSDVSEAHDPDYEAATESSDADASDTAPPPDLPPTTPPIVKPVIPRIKCVHCKRQFARAVDLARHVMRIHSTDPLPHTALCCARAFASKHERNRHQLQHSGAPLPFKCDMCDMAFVSAFRLKLHARAHSDERHYACSVCAKPFKTVAGEARHRMTHDQPFDDLKCRYCTRRFAYRYGAAKEKHEREHEERGDRMI